MLKGLKVCIVLVMVLIFAGCKASESEKEPEIIGNFSIQASPSPKQLNIIEIKEMYAENKEGLHTDSEAVFHSLRIYYGEYGSLLENYKEIKDIDMPAIDYFDVVWADDEHVSINVMHRNEAGENFVFESYELDFLTSTLEK